MVIVTNKLIFNHNFSMGSAFFSKYYSTTGCENPMKNNSVRNLRKEHNIKQQIMTTFLMISLFR